MCLVSDKIDKIEDSLRDLHPEVKFKTIHYERDDEYFIGVDKGFLDSVEGERWLLWTKILRSDAGITSIFIVPWKNPDYE